MLKLVAVDGVRVGAKRKAKAKPSDPQPEVNKDVVDLLTMLTAEAKAGRVAAIALVALDEGWHAQPATAGEASVAVMAEYCRMLHELVARLSLEQSRTNGFRYFREVE